MKFAIITFFNRRYAPVGDITSTVIANYCRRYGFDFICSMDESLYDGRTPLWAKIPLIKKNLKNYDWIMWIDGDAMPVNFTFNALNFIDSNYDLILAEEQHPEGAAINTGVLFMKNSVLSEVLLDGTWQQTQCINHCWGEQQGLIEFLRKNPVYNGCIKKISPHPINVSPKEFSKNDFIVHVAGGPRDVYGKAKLLFDFSQQIIY